MEWQVIAALVLGMPIILFPAAYVWCLNIGGLYATVKERREAGQVAAEHAGTR